jgi:hypothetical protein
MSNDHCVRPARPMSCGQQLAIGMWVTAAKLAGCDTVRARPPMVQPWTSG